MASDNSLCYVLIIRASIHVLSMHTHTHTECSGCKLYEDGVCIRFAHSFVRPFVVRSSAAPNSEHYFPNNTEWVGAKSETVARQSVL